MATAAAPCTSTLTTASVTMADSTPFEIGRDEQATTIINNNSNSLLGISNSAPISLSRSATGSVAGSASLRPAPSTTSNSPATAADPPVPTAFTKSESLVKVVKGGHQHKIKNPRGFRLCAAHSIYSNEFTVNGHSWQIVSYLGGETENVSEHISLFLGYLGPAEQCRANWLLRCVNQRDPTKSRVREWKKGDKHNTFQKGRRWGWQKFILQREAFLEENGFLGPDDSLCFEAEVEVHGHVMTTQIPLKPTESLPSFKGLASQSHESLSMDLNKLFLRSTDGPRDPFADTVVECGGLTFHLHSQILASRSPVFARMLSGSFKEREANGSIMFRVNIGDIDPAIFNEVIRYIYTGNMNVSALRGLKDDTITSGDISDDYDSLDKVATSTERRTRKRTRNLSEKEIDFENAVDGNGNDAAYLGSHSQTQCKKTKTKSRTSKRNQVKVAESEEMYAADKPCEDFDLVAALMEAADKYEITHLRKLCESYLARIITPKTAIDTLLLADRHSAKELKELTLRYLGVVSNLSEVKKVSAPAWRNLDKGLIDEILNSVALEASNVPEPACTRDLSPQISSKGTFVNPNIPTTATTFAAFPSVHSQQLSQQQHPQFVHFSQLFPPFVTTPAAFFI